MLCLTILFARMSYHELVQSTEEFQITIAMIKYCEFSYASSIRFPKNNYDC